MGDFKGFCVSIGRTYFGDGSWGRSVRSFGYIIFEIFIGFSSRFC